MAPLPDVKNIVSVLLCKLIVCAHFWLNTFNSLIRLYLALVILQFVVPLPVKQVLKDQGTTKLIIIRLGHLDLRSPGAFLA